MKGVTAKAHVALLADDEEVLLVIVRPTDKDALAQIGTRVLWVDVIAKAEAMDKSDYCSPRNQTIDALVDVYGELARDRGEVPYALRLHEKGDEYHLHNRYCSHRTSGQNQVGSFANAEEAQEFWSKNIISMTPVIRNCVPENLIRGVEAKREKEKVYA